VFFTKKKKKSRSAMSLKKKKSRSVMSLKKKKKEEQSTQIGDELEE
jgi:hypothetical protein